MYRVTISVEGKPYSGLYRVSGPFISLTSEYGAAVFSPGATDPRRSAECYLAALVQRWIEDGAD